MSFLREPDFALEFGLVIDLIEPKKYQHSATFLLREF